QAAFRKVRRLLNILEARKGRGLVGPVEFAGIDASDRNAHLPERLAEGSRQRLAVVVEIALRGNVVQMEGVSVGLIGERGAVADNDDEAATAQSRCQRLIVNRCRRLSECGRGCNKAAR